MKKIILIIALAVTLTAAAIFSYRTCNNALVERARLLDARKASWAILKTEIAHAIQGYRGDVAIVIKDLDTNWQLDHDKDVPVPSASLVKLPIMAAYFAAVGEGRIRLSDSVELKNSDKVEGSGLLKNALAGSSYRIEDLLSLMITESDNTAANILINRFGMDELNRYFSKLGLKHTNLSRKMMDFRFRKEGVENYTTAADMAYLLEGLYHGRFFNKTLSDQCLKLLAEQKINDRIPKKLPSDTPVAHKTGLENGVCHDAGIVYTPKGSFLICVLTKHEYVTARFTKRLISRLALLTYNYYNGL